MKASQAAKNKREITKPARVPIMSSTAKGDNGGWHFPGGAFRGLKLQLCHGTDFKFAPNRF